MRPTVGDSAKACTDGVTPERVMYMPSAVSRNGNIAIDAFHPARRPPARCTSEEWRNAVAASQGRSEVFSTASHAQNPPQPSSTYAQFAPAAMPTVSAVQETHIQRRVTASQRWSTAPATRAATVVAKGISRLVSPR